MTLAKRNLPIFQIYFVLSAYIDRLTAIHARLRPSNTL
jgi:hypothetical protein